jgi:hypothetical protein
MNSLTIKRHQPGSVDGLPYDERKLDRASAIANLDYVKKIKQDLGTSFHQYSIAPEPGGYNVLAETDGGSKFYVIAMVTCNQASFEDAKNFFPLFSPPMHIGPTADELKKSGFYPTPGLHPEYAQLTAQSSNITQLKLPGDRHAGITRVVEEANNGNLGVVRKHALELMQSEAELQARVTLGDIDASDLVQRQQIRKRAAEVALLQNYFILKGEPEWDLDDPAFQPGMRLRFRVPQANVPGDAGMPELLVVRPFKMAAAVKETISLHALYPTGIDVKTGAEAETATQGWNGMQLWDRYVLVIGFLEANGYVTKAIPTLSVNVADFLHGV